MLGYAVLAASVFYVLGVFTHPPTRIAKIYLTHSPRTHELVRAHFLVVSPWIFSLPFGSFRQENVNYDCEGGDHTELAAQARSDAIASAKRHVVWGPIYRGVDWAVSIL